MPFGPEGSDSVHLPPGSGNELDLDDKIFSQFWKKTLIRKNALLLSLSINPYFCEMTSRLFLLTYQNLHNEALDDLSPFIACAPATHPCSWFHEHAVSVSASVLLPVLFPVPGSLSPGGKTCNIWSRTPILESNTYWSKSWFYCLVARSWTSWGSVFPFKKLAS